jgi:ribosome maturation factor RimP
MWGRFPTFFYSLLVAVEGGASSLWHMNKDLESIVEREVDALGYDIVLLRQSGTRSRPVLEIRIDRRDGERVSIADCARVSRAVEARLDAGVGDAAIFGGGRYELQVSSPGDARRARDAQAGAKESDAGRPGVEDGRLG